MFALIVAIIAIALTVAIAGAVMYYGGDVATNSGAKAVAGQYRSEASQIAGAITAYRAEGNPITEDFTLNALVPHYLKTLPNVKWNVDANRIYMDDIEEGVCLAANDSAKMYFTPNGTDILPADGNPEKGIPICTDTLSLSVPCCIRQ
jgi:type II secretory pathway pseudopilin PulG